MNRLRLGWAGSALAGLLLLGGCAVTEAEAGPPQTLAPNPSATAA